LYQPYPIEICNQLYVIVYLIVLGLIGMVCAVLMRPGAYSDITTKTDAGVTPTKPATSD